MVRVAGRRRTASRLDGGATPRYLGRRLPDTEHLINPQPARRPIPRIVLTAQVEDSQKWIERFQAHGDLFRELGTTVIHYTATDENEVALYEEVDDVDRYFEVMQSPAIVEAMAGDGVKRDTVKVFVLDREWRA